MSNIFWKNFYLCFSKFKCLSTTLPPPPPSPSSQQDHSLPPSTLTLIKNFNSPYDLTSDSTTTTSKSLTSSDDFFSSSDDSDTDSPPDLATIFASERFFFSSPGRSNSIIETPDSPPEPDAVVAGGVAVRTYSPDPYSDFRRSMQEMIEARRLTDVEADWDYLHELLLCYLTLNPKHTHKFIVGAFSDLLVSLMSSSTTTMDSHRRPKSCQRSAVSRRLL